MREIEKLHNNYFFRLRDPNRRDDVIIEVDKLLKLIINYIIEYGEGGEIGELYYDPEVEDHITSSKEVGNIPIGTPAGILRGLTFTQMWDKALFAAVPPTYLAPSLVLTGTGDKIIEVGSVINPTLSGIFTQNDAGLLISTILKKDGVTITSDNPYTDVGLTSPIPKVFKYVQTVNYEEGEIKTDSYGNPYPEGHIQAGSINSNSVNYEFIYPYFWGKTINPNISTDNIVAGNKVIQKISNSITIDFNTTSEEYFWFAVPASIPNFTHWFVTSLNQGNIGGSNDLFGPPGTVQLTTPNFTNINYKVYITNYSSELTLPIILSI